MNKKGVFYNEYGEKFIVEQIIDNIALVRGDEVGWEQDDEGNDIIKDGNRVYKDIIYTVNGWAPNFLLSKEERKNIVKFSSRKTMYENTGITVQSKGDFKTGKTYLLSENGNKVCPICLKESKKGTKYHKHHVVYACVGGSDGKHNILELCQVCHIRGTHGNTMELNSIHRICWHHQHALYGFKFFMQLGGNNRYKKSRDFRKSDDWFYLKKGLKLYGINFLNRKVSSLDEFDKIIWRNIFGNSDETSGTPDPDTSCQYWRAIWNNHIPWEWVESKMERARLYKNHIY